MGSVNAADDAASSSEDFRSKEGEVEPPLGVTEIMELGELVESGKAAGSIDLHKEGQCWDRGDGVLAKLRKTRSHELKATTTYISHNSARPKPRAVYWKFSHGLADTRF